MIARKCAVNKIGPLFLRTINKKEHFVLLPAKTKCSFFYCPRAINSNFVALLATQTAGSKTCFSSLEIFILLIRARSVRLDSAHFCAPLDSQKIQLFGDFFFCAGFGLRWIHKKSSCSVFCFFTLDWTGRIQRRALDSLFEW